MDGVNSPCPRSKGNEEVVHSARGVGSPTATSFEVILKGLGPEEALVKRPGRRRLSMIFEDASS